LGATAAFLAHGSKPTYECGSTDSNMPMSLGIQAITIPRVGKGDRGHSLDESIRISITTTGMAVFFTGSTLVGGIIFWYFISSLRFAADMSLLMSIVLAANMVGAMILVPSMTSLFKPQFASGETVEEMHKREASKVSSAAG
jgi:hypothetical protein